jgi:hypothetical protein
VKQQGHGFLFLPKDPVPDRERHRMVISKSIEVPWFGEREIERWAIAVLTSWSLKPNAYDVVCQDSVDMLRVHLGFDIECAPGRIKDPNFPLVTTLSQLKIALYVFAVKLETMCPCK